MANTCHWKVSFIRSDSVSSNSASTKLAVNIGFSLIDGKNTQKMTGKFF